MSLHSSLFTTATVNIMQVRFALQIILNLRHYKRQSMAFAFSCGLLTEYVSVLMQLRHMR